jgi:hypothetical protein
MVGLYWCARYRSASFRCDCGAGQRSSPEQCACETISRLVANAMKRFKDCDKQFEDGRRKTNEQAHERCRGPSTTSA